MGGKKVRVLIGKVGLDSHDSGSKFVAHILREAGMEVIYLPRFQTENTILHAAMDEDVDVLGLSFLSGEYKHYVPRIYQELKAKGLTHIKMVIGGLIAEEDMSMLKENGVELIFLPGTSGSDIVKGIRELC